MCDRVICVGLFEVRLTFKIAHCSIKEKNKPSPTVPQHLIVDLHRADGDGVGPHVLPLLDHTKEVFEGSLVDAGVLNAALKDLKDHSVRRPLCYVAPAVLLNPRTHLHSVRFARARLSVGKYADVVAVDAGRHQGFDLLKDLMGHRVEVFGSRFNRLFSEGFPL